MSSHREAPEISKDPVADSTDVYAFVSPDKPDTVTLIANYLPLQAPAGGPNFYEFGDDVLYEIHVDNDGDGCADVTYQFQFTTTVTQRRTRSSTTPARSQSLTSANWNRRQSYTVTRVTGGGGIFGDQPGGHPRPQPGLPAVQHRPAVHAGLPGARRGRDPQPRRRPHRVRRPARRGVLRRPRLHLRPGRPAPVRQRAQHVRPVRHAGEVRSRRERHQGPQRALHRHPGPDHRPHQGRLERKDPDRPARHHRRLDDRQPPAGAALGRPSAARTSTPARTRRSPGWATRCSTRSWCR